ncbi:hypothetical cytosolic protein [Coxiella burnetii RSA 493]|uniref:Hypothetical cytosolic protein n=1 Tax=Coxiella burnetii (strain RSA 493 / Nine Mile phase I) TaxID=227377 RepID=Q83E00_COXBU|nr:hypothetical cytosolic protein [Coxiella burnetii RSA 493]BBL37305.1 hypothetical cytosolic protein [Coxiella burnetii]BBL38341.1 hypothetical cytosolic protein [Coxiella burnetii]
MLSFALFLSKFLDTTDSYYYPAVVKREKLKTRRPSARPSAVLLKDTKPSRPSREDPD